MGNPFEELSVALLSYRRGPLLREALISVQNQSLSPSRVTIFDNGSPPEEAFSYVEDLLDGRTRFEGTSHNHGVHWNLRRAFGSAASGFLYVMHDDDRLLPTFLEEQVRFLKAHPLARGVACNARLVNPQGIPLIKRGAPHLLHNPGKREGTEWFANTEEVARLYLRTYLAFPTLVYRVPSEDPDSLLACLREEYGEVLDVVFLCELARTGPLAYRNQVGLEYRVHPGQSSSSFRKNDLLRLEGYFRERGTEFPTLRRPVERYLMRRRLSRFWARLKTLMWGSRAAQG